MTPKETKTLAALKAVVTEIEERKKAIEAELTTAQGDYYAAEREIKWNEKPTPAMVRALNLLATDGATVRHRTFSPYGNSIHVNGDYEHIRDSVFYGLLSRNAIDRKERDVMFDIYTLTDHGREIQQRATKESSDGNN